MTPIDIIAYNSAFITLLINSFALYDQKKYLTIFYLILFILYQIVITLKNIIKQPRPSGYLTMDDGGKYINREKYGMPSGHSAFVFYSTVFLWLVKQNIPLLIIELFLCAITVYQRYHYKKHTIEQLVAGALLGAAVAFGSYQIAVRYFKKS